MNLPDVFMSILEIHAYPTFFLFLLLYSFTMPITEEIALILVGIFAARLEMPLVLTLLVAYPGIFGSDIGYYWLARRFGCSLLRSRFLGRFINARKVAASEMYFKKRGPRIAFFCRFIVGIRAPAMIAAGMLRMPFKYFVLYDGLAAVGATAIWLSLGYFWGDIINAGMSTLATVLAMLAPLALGVVIVISFRKIRSIYNNMHGETHQDSASVPTSSAIADCTDLQLINANPEQPDQSQDPGLDSQSAI
jgi:membrane protein DedA with SNARE-associated domain